MNNGKYRNLNHTRDSENSKSKLCCFGYVDYIFLASTLAVSIGDELNTTDLSILSTFFAVLADELALIGSIKSCPSSDDTSTEEVFTPPVAGVSSGRSSKKVIKKKKIKKRKKV